MDPIVQIKWGKKMYEGTVTYQEGDIVEVVFHEPLGAAVGDPVNCIITHNYSEVQNINGVVLAKDDKRIILFYSPTITEFREQRRRYPRFDVEVDGLIRVQAEDGTREELIVKVTNVSLGGVAIESRERLQIKTPFRLAMELTGQRNEGRVELNAEIIHIREQERFLYGCKVTGISARSLHILRRYILNRQLEMLKRPIDK